MVYPGTWKWNAYVAVLFIERRASHIRKSEPYIFNAYTLSLKGYYAVWLRTYDTHTRTPIDSNVQRAAPADAPR